ncbi:MAG: hypothetical protein EAX95_13615 [Candidatus Thorarchaeota archaeon]|nr:hypothetical protein [Candidatus Thorarchaeota archaeon]
MSTKKTTAKSSSKKTKLIRTRGMALSVKLFKLSDMSLSAAQLVTELKKIEYSPKATKLSAGFSGVKTTGKTVSADMIASFMVPVLAYDKDGNLAPKHYMSVDKGEVFVKLDKGTVEIRGSERIARKFRQTLDDISDAKLSPLNLNGGTKKIYEKAADIASVMLTGVEKGNLTQAEFRGVGIQNEEEIGLYTRRYKGEITRFRGTFPYPSGAFLTTSVNAESGSLMIYRTGDGIAEKDLNWIVELMEDAALTQ